MAEICQRVLDGFGMPVELPLSIMVPLLMGNGDIRYCSCYRVVKLPEHRVKVVKRELIKRLCIIVMVEKVRSSFMPKSGTINAVFIMRRMHEEYNATGNKFCAPREGF